MNSLGKPNWNIIKEIRRRTPFYLQAEEAGAKFQLRKISEASGLNLEYSTNGQTGWANFNFDVEYTLENIGDRFYIRNNGTHSAYFDDGDAVYYNFDVNNGKIGAYGNIQFLIDQTGRKSDTRSLVREAPYYNYTFITYNKLFKDCTNLTHAPFLMADIIADDSTYMYMFSGCTSLKVAPEIYTEYTDDESYNNFCTYYRMFYGCTNLIDAPLVNFPKSIDAEYRYAEMFYGCEKLTHVKTIGDYFYNRVEQRTDPWGFLDGTAIGTTGIFECTKAMAKQFEERGGSPFPSNWIIKTYD